MRRTALVTGANRGIGLAVAGQLAQHGLRVVVAARQRAAGEAAAQRLSSQGAEIATLELDVASAASLEQTLGELDSLGVEVDVLVNNAGVLVEGGVIDSSPQAFEQSLAVNFFGALRCARAFVPGMIARGYGRVVNVTSGWGCFGGGLDEAPAPYGASKAALNALTVLLAEEVRGDVKINAVDPGWVRTRLGGEQATRDAEQAATGVVWAATLPADGPSGGCFHDRRRVPW